MLEIKMKKLVTTVILMLFFGSSAYALGTPSFSINEGDNQKGTLSMQELFIGGIKTHDNVKIEFDFKNSTFRLLEIVEADTSIPAQPVESITTEGVTVGLRGCNSENRVITCHLIITSNEFDGRISFCTDSDERPDRSHHCGNSGESTAFDNLNNSYIASKVTLANESSPVSIRDLLLVADIPTEATVEFSNISTRATNFSLMVLGFEISGTDFTVEFRNVDFN